MKKHSKKIVCTGLTCLCFFILCATTAWASTFSGYGGNYGNWSYPSSYSSFNNSYGAYGYSSFNNYPPTFSGLYNYNSSPSYNPVYTIKYLNPVGSLNTFSSFSFQLSNNYNLGNNFYNDQDLRPLGTVIIHYDESKKPDSTSTCQDYDDDGICNDDELNGCFNDPAC